VLWSGDGLGPVATDGTNVYFGRFANVYRIPPAGEPVTRLTNFEDPFYQEAWLERLAVGPPDANGKVLLAWATYVSGVQVTTDPSVAPQLLGATVAVHTLQVDGDGSLLWCEDGAPFRKDADAGSSSPPPFESGRSFRERLGSEPTPIPGCAAPGFELTAAIAAISKNDPSAPPIATPVAATDATTVYFSPSDDPRTDPPFCDGLRVFALDKGSGAVRTLVDTGCNSVTAMVVDERDVYVVSLLGTESPQVVRTESRIFRIPKSGGTPELIQTPKPYTVFFLAVDANALYWSGGDTRTPNGGWSYPPPVGVVVRVPK
jgi:hypothetical protein